jgi:hypothetical protein
MLQKMRCWLICTWPAELLSTACQPMLDCWLQGASPYQVWQLRELAVDSSCRAAMLEAGAIPTLAALLADKCVSNPPPGSITRLP